MKLTIYYAKRDFIISTPYKFPVRSKTTSRYTHIPKSASTDRFSVLSLIPQGELNVSLQRRSPPPPRVVIWLSQTSLPFTFPRGFSCLFHCVKSIDRLDRNRHGCRIWSNGQKRGWSGKMTKQTWPCCVKKSPRTMAYLRPLRPLCCQNPDFFSYWKPYIPWLDTKKRERGRKKIGTREVLIEVFFLLCDVNREI